MLDIFNGFNWWYVIIYFDMKPEIAQNQDGTNTTVVDLQLITWGHETLLSRWFYWGTGTYPDGEANGWWGKENGWFEDLSFTATIGAAFSFDLDTGKQYDFSGTTAEGTIGTDQAKPVWVWEAQLIDYMPNSSTNKPRSELNPYYERGMTYLNGVPGSPYYNTEYRYDYVPSAWDLGPGEMITFKMPKGEVIFFDPLQSEWNNATKKPDLVSRMGRMTLHSLFPEDAGVWYEDEKTLVLAGPFSVDVEFPPPFGHPYIEFGMETGSSSAPPMTQPSSFHPLIQVVARRPDHLIMPVYREL